MPPREITPSRNSRASRPGQSWIDRGRTPAAGRLPLNQGTPGNEAQEASEAEAKAGDRLFSPPELSPSSECENMSGTRKSSTIDSMKSSLGGDLQSQHSMEGIERDPGAFADDGNRHDENSKGHAEQIADTGESLQSVARQNYYLLGMGAHLSPPHTTTTGKSWHQDRVGNLDATEKTFLDDEQESKS